LLKNKVGQLRNLNSYARCRYLIIV